MSHKNILKINESTYDAMTGELIDGPGEGIKPAEVIKKARQVAQHAPAHKRDKSKTLMRHSVKKPNPEPNKSEHRATLPIQHTKTVNKKLSATSINLKRQKKSTEVSRHQKIAKFSSDHNPNQSTLHRENGTKETARVSFELKKKTATTNDLLMHAIMLSKSHEQTYNYKKSGPLSFLQKKSAQAAIIAMIGVIMVVSLMPVIELKMASSKAGFNVDKPNYQPSGFSLKKISANPGNVELKYMSNSDDRSFSVNEKVSNIDNSVLSGVLAMSTDNKTVVTPRGKTIFIDSKGNAAWTTEGLQYTISTSGVLSPRQVIQIADSL